MKKKIETIVCDQCDKEEDIGPYQIGDPWLVISYGDGVGKDFCSWECVEGFAGYARGNHSGNSLYVYSEDPITGVKGWR